MSKKPNLGLLAVAGCLGFEGGHPAAGSLAGNTVGIDTSQSLVAMGV